VAGTQARCGASEQSTGPLLIEPAIQSRMDGFDHLDQRSTRLAMWPSGPLLHTALETQKKKANDKSRKADSLLGLWSLST